MSNPWEIQTTEYDRTNSEGNVDAYGYGQLSILLSKYVLKEKGKGLSSNDFTDADLAKLNSIENGAQVNTLETLTVNGGEKIYPTEDKNINLAIPSKISELDNDLGYAKLVGMSSEPNYADSYVGKAKYAFQDETKIAIGKNADASKGGIAIGANTTTTTTYDVNINNQLRHNSSTNMWEGKITEAEKAYKNANGTNLTQLDTVISNLATETQNRINSDTALQNSLTDEAQYRLSADITLQNNINAESQTRSSADSALSSRITDIEEVIPNQATPSNQLADKAFVNSTIQTNTANFRGNWATWSDVPTTANSYPQDYEGDKTPTVNDYLVVEDASDYTLETLVGTWRFKYTGVWATVGKSGWIPEYRVNEEPFTSEQWSAINSGITSNKVTSYNSHISNTNNPHSVTKAQVGLGSVVNTGDSATPTSGGTTKFTTGGAYTELNKKVDKVSGKGLSTNDFTNDYKSKLDNIDDTVTADSSNLVTSGAVSTAISNTIDGLDVSSVGGSGKYISAISETDGKISATSTSTASTFSASSTTAINGVGVNEALKTLDVASVGGSGKYISAISETDGKISATATSMDTTPTASSTNAVTSGGVKTAIDNAIGALDVSSVGGDGKYISAISETDGKISATSTTMDTTPTANSTKAVTSDGIKTAISTAETNAKNLANATGTLAISHGGTNSTTADGAVTNLLSATSQADADVTDDTDLITSHANGYTTTNNKFYKRKGSKLWNYISGKISSVLGLTATSYGGNSATATSATNSTNATYSTYLGTSSANYSKSTLDTALSGKVPTTRKVNGHALSADVTVSKSDVGLGNVANTGDSATPVSGGTTKFTTGGAYTELAKKVDKVDGKGLSSNDFTTTDKTAIRYYGTCATARNVVAKVVTCANFALETGCKIVVKFTDTSTSTPASGDITLSINDTTAKNVYNKNNTKMTYSHNSFFYNNAYCEFTYDGTNYIWLNYDSNTTYSTITQAEITAGTSTSSRLVTPKLLADNFVKKESGKELFSGSYNDLTDRPSTVMYCTCATVAGTAVNELVKVNNCELITGTIIAVKFSATNTASSVQFTFDGGTTKYSIYYNNAVYTGTSNSVTGYANRTIYYMFDGTNFVYQSDGLVQDGNNAVTQTASTGDADYEVLFSVTADNTTRTEGARKNSNLKFNPSSGNLTVTTVNGFAFTIV